MFARDPISSIAWAKFNFNPIRACRRHHLDADRLWRVPKG